MSESSRVHYRYPEEPDRAPSPAFIRAGITLAELDAYREDAEREDARS